MAELKTQPTSEDVLTFIASIDNEQRRKDAEAVLALYRDITGEEAVMWGPSIIGFGSYQYQNKDGKQHSFLRSGFSPRKQNMTVYVGAGMSEHPELLEGLGKHKTSKACLYFTKLSSVDQEKLIAIIKADLEVMNRRYPN